MPPTLLLLAALLCPAAPPSAREGCRHDPLEVSGGVTGRAIWRVRGNFEPLPALTVELLGQEGGRVLASGRSDEKGEFVVSGVEPGTYRVRAWHPIAHWVGELTLRVGPPRDGDERPDLITFALGKGPGKCGGWLVTTSKPE